MDERGTIRAAAAAALVAGCAFLVQAVPAVDTLVDDAWISARYARNAALGQGLVFNTDDVVVEGYTNLAWTMWLTVAHALDWPIAECMAWGGLVCTLLALPATAALAAALSGRWHPGVVVAPLLLGLDPHVAVAATNGLETGLALLTLPIAATAWLVARGRWAWAAGVLVGSTTLVRPEAAFLVLALCVEAGVRHRDRGALPLVLPALAVPIGLAAWRWAIYGALLPNTAVAKRGAPLVNQLADNVTSYFAPEAPWWIGVAVVLVGGVAVAPRAPARWALGAAMAGMVATAMSVELWMPGARLFLPPLVLAVSLVAAGTAIGDGARWLAGAALVGQALFLVSPLRDRVVRYDEIHSALPGNGAERAARHLAQHLPANAWVAVRDAGVFAYNLGPNVRAGETHPRALTRLHPDGAPSDLGFLPQNPAAIVLTVARIDAEGIRYSNDRRVFEGTTRRYRYLGRVHQHFHRFYDIHVRADLDVPPLPDGVIVRR